MQEKKSWRPFIIYLLIVIIGSALAGYAEYRIRLFESGGFRREAEQQADAGRSYGGTKETIAGGARESVPAETVSTESGILEPPGLPEEEEEAPVVVESPFAGRDPSLVYPPAYNISVSGFDGLPFTKEAFVKALGDFGYENNLTITRADYAGDLKGNGNNAVSFGIQANADTDIYITATYFRDYGRFLFIFDERTAAVSPAQQTAGQGSAAGINPYAANDIVIYDIPTEVYTMFRSEDGFREALYVYLTEQGIYTDTVVAGEWYEINGDTAFFVLEAQGWTIQATYDAARDLYAFS